MKKRNKDFYAQDNTKQVKIRIVFCPYRSHCTPFMKTAAQRNLHRRRKTFVLRLTNRGRWWVTKSWYYIQIRPTTAAPGCTNTKHSKRIIFNPSPLHATRSLKPYDKTRRNVVMFQKTKKSEHIIMREPYLLVSTKKTTSPGLIVSQ